MKFDPKQTLIHHGEKMVFALGILVVLWVLFTTDWVAYSGTPAAIENKVNEGRKTLLSQKWPDTEREKFRLTDADKPAQIVHEELFSKIDPRHLEMPGKMVVDLFASTEPVTEPKWLPPEDLIASTSKVFLHTKPSESNTENIIEEAPEEPQKAPETNVPDEFRSRIGTGQEATGSRKGRDTISTIGQLAGELGRSSVTDYSQLAQKYRELTSGTGGNVSALSDMGAHGLSGEGRHFVSVRAVFPLREQIREISDAIHRGAGEAAQQFDIRDFVLERQIMRPGDDPWSGPWETVDLKIASEVLDKAAGFDADVVNSAITNSVITMPLPMRISGQWFEQATHPRIEQFVLSDEEMEIEVEMNKRLLEQAAMKQQRIDEKERSKGGFAQFQFDTAELQRNATGVGMDLLQGGGGTNIAELMRLAQSSGFDLNSLSGPGLPPMAFSSPPPRGQKAKSGASRTAADILVHQLLSGSENSAEQEAKIRKWIAERVSAEGELLLFRYLDFDVEPGKTYRYRVKFVVANPNFGKRPADAGGIQAIVEGETRETPWSNPTEPVTVKRESQYFVHTIREQAGRILDVVQMDVFQWDTSLGTTVNSKLEIRPGQTIGDEIQTTVIEPAKFQYGERKYRFKSKDYLVDSFPDLHLERRFHTDERIPSELRLNLNTGSRGDLVLTPMALVNTEHAGLESLNNVEQQDEYDQALRYLNMQAQQFAHLKSGEGGALEGVTGIPEEYRALLNKSGFSTEQISEFLGGNKRTRNALRKERPAGGK